MTKKMIDGERQRNFVYKIWFLICFGLIVIGTVVTVLVLNAGRYLAIEDYGIEHETKFGGVYIKMGIEEFNERGFKYGDSVDVSFSNGYELRDIPYYNGFYVEINEPLLISYPGYDYIKVMVNYGDDLWKTAGLGEEDTATVRLRQREKYLKTQLVRDISYSNEQGEMADEVFGNFRNVRFGRMREGVLYRSASPVDNVRKRAHVVDELIRKAGVKYIVDLSDGEEEIAKHFSRSSFNSPYFRSLYDNGKVVALGASTQFKAEDFKKKLKRGLSKMAENEGPYLIHCVEGKDRTGFVMMVLEGLAGATYDEMVEDYMKTYENYYGIARDGDRERYEAIKEQNIDVMLHYVINDEAGEVMLPLVSDYAEKIATYLEGIGMGKEEIARLRGRIAE